MIKAFEGFRRNPRLAGAKAAKDQSRPKPWQIPSTWLREPLLHFLIIGGLIFGAYSLLGPAPSSGGESKRIVLTQDDLRQLAIQWLAQGRPPPSKSEMRELIEQKVSEEILFREAMALGLDKNDEIIRRRLAQKMDFLAEDVAALQVPDDAVLKAWFTQNSERFALPTRVTFRHLYFSSDRGAGSRDAASGVLIKIAGKPADSPEIAAAPADTFMFQDYYAEKTPEQVTREFGPNFSKAVFLLAPGAWRGPIQSGYGWHLVFVQALEPGRVPAFEEVEPDVKTAWLDERQREFKRTAFEAMRARYTVVVPPIEALDWGSLKQLPVAATDVAPQ